MFPSGYLGEDESYAETNGQHEDDQDYSRHQYPPEKKLNRHYLGILSDEYHGKNHEDDNDYTFDLHISSFGTQESYRKNERQPLQSYYKQQIADVNRRELNEDQQTCRKSGQRRMCPSAYIELAMSRE